MLQELSMVEQRYQAVREVLEGARINDVATRYNVNRKTVHRWLRQYADGGLGALADRGCKPHTCPHQISPELEARIVAMRRAHPAWGPRTILNRLRRLGLDNVPSRSAIYRCLVRHRLIEPKKRRRRREDYKRWERSRAMELWQIDVMGGVRLADGTSLSVVTGVDDHSRFCILATLVVRATARPVCDALLSALKRHGVPDQILTDRGKVFTGTLTGAAVLFDRICRNNGIRHILTAPYSPTTTGKIERLHKTMRKEFFSGRVFESMEAAQAALDAWVEDYNTRREHQAIGDVAPVRRFELARPAALEVIDGDAPVVDEPAPKSHGVTRRVDDKGRISILEHRYHVGRYLAGQTVTVTSQDGLLHVRHHDVVVATHARRHKPEDDERMDRRTAAAKPSRPTKGNEVIRGVNSSGSISFAGTDYRVGNRYIGQKVGVRIVGDTVQITADGILVRTHRARHDRSREYGALAQPNGKPRRVTGVA